MTHSALQSHGHSHAHGAQGHSHGHHHAHSHDPAAPHPAQPAPWSILRMPVTVRLGAALAASAVLWVIVILAMR
ncbi:MULTISPECIES: hypothetical protein [unclassified Bradyrhizobium]|uniref:hypothetical protein n=1 Tax=unclassified Bradyrhizobium TaxID=2631580 RepID=UPI0028EC4DE8|nr:MULTISPECIES: hypothetical protein [unclassified Bradyrhizobium]